MRESIVAVVSLVLIMALNTGTATQQPGPAEQPIFRSSTRLVVEAVTVTGKDGVAIEGLSVSDFAVTENGEPQVIAFVEFQRLAGERRPVPARVEPAPAATTVSSFALQASDSGAYRDRRLIVLYFDSPAMGLEDRARALSDARRYVATKMEPADLVAIMSFDGGGVRIRHDFTDNRAALAGVIDRLSFGDDQDGDGMPDDGTITPTAFGQGDGEFNIFNTDRQLSALQTAVTMLRPLAQQKTLVYFSSGVRLNGSDNQAQLRATTNAAIRANVTINPIDARGLAAQPPLGDATRPSPAGIGMLSGQTEQIAAARFQRSQDTLYSLAKDTGGTALFDYNDLALGIVQAAQAQGSYYLVGYYTSNLAADGQYRRVRVSVPGRTSIDLKYRQGYFADKQFARFNAADKERQLEEALMLENPLTDITIALEVNYFQLNSAEYFVPVAAKLPGSELALARGRGASRTVIDFVGEVKDEFGTTIQNVRDKLDLKLNDASAAQLSVRPIQYETGFTLLPGKYIIKILARDAVTGRIGTYQAPFVIPNLAREAIRLPISSVVLSSQRVAAGQALYQVKGHTLAAHPLVSDGQRLIPSVTRVFSRSRTMHVFLEAYPVGGQAAGAVMGFAALYAGEQKVLETPIFKANAGQKDRPDLVSLGFTVPMGSVAPGEYECQITVLAPDRGKAAFWRAPVSVVP